ncbi:MAG: fluoride efflux transporter CrcB [Lachnospiraceae bacterium]|nr:fluoride efflux transporter CrcB [Lachnospiraceae bacterium]
MDIMAVGMGGFVGAVLRYLIGLVPIRESAVFPIKTFVINVIGCAAIGIITILASKNPNINPRWILFLKVGICGGFTTFSTFALEATDLVKNGYMGIAFLYVILSIFTGVVVIFGTEMAIGK